MQRSAILALDCAAGKSPQIPHPSCLHERERPPSRPPPGAQRSAIMALDCAADRSSQIKHPSCRRKRDRLPSRPPPGAQRSAILALDCAADKNLHKKRALAKSPGPHTSESTELATYSSSNAPV